jgi:hypothetical protein
MLAYHDIPIRVGDHLGTDDNPDPYIIDEIDRQADLVLVTGMFNGEPCVETWRLSRTIQLIERGSMRRLVRQLTLPGMPL